MTPSLDFPPPHAPASEVCWQAVAHLLELADQSRFALQIPPLNHHVEEHPGMHFHFAPDFVVVLGGRCRLQFIDEEIVLNRDEMAVIPAGIPHREVPVARAHEPFRFLQFSIYNHTVGVRLETSEPGAQTLAAQRLWFDSPKDELLTGYLDELCELFHSRDSRRHFGIKGLLLAYLGTLAGIMEHARESPPGEKLKVSQARRFVQEYLGSPELGVKYLAALLHCSPDYLSHLFHDETGQRLAIYINAERVKVAKEMLRNTALTISEVAYAVGYQSQAYFSRVFKRMALTTPMDYRRLVEHSVIELEGRPQTIHAGS